MSIVTIAAVIIVIIVVAAATGATVSAKRCRSAAPHSSRASTISELTY